MLNVGKLNPLPDELYVLWNEGIEPETWMLGMTIEGNSIDLLRTVKASLIASQISSLVFPFPENISNSS